MLVNSVVLLLVIIIGGLFLINHKIDYNSNKIRIIYVIIVSIILILQSGLRNWAVGPDTYAYYLWFDDIKYEEWNFLFAKFLLFYQHGIGKDPGYEILVKLFQIFSGNYQVYLFFVAILWFSSLGFFLMKFTTNFKQLIPAYIFYLVMFFSFYSITGIRQTIAMSLCLFSFHWIDKRKFLPVLLLIILASTLHKSSLIFILAYFIYTFKYTKSIYIVSFLVFPIIFALKNIIFNILISSSGYELYDEFEGAGTYVFSSLLMLLGFFILLQNKDLLKINEKTQGILNIFAMAIILTPLTFVNPNAMRIVMYFSFFIIIIIPYLIESYNYKGIQVRKIVSLMIYILLIILFIRTNSSFEYKFFWQEMPLGENY